MYWITDYYEICIFDTVITVIEYEMEFMSTDLITSNGVGFTDT